MTDNIADLSREITNLQLKLTVATDALKRVAKDTWFDEGHGEFFPTNGARHAKDALKLLAGSPVAYSDIITPERAAHILSLVATEFEDDNWEPVESETVYLPSPNPVFKVGEE